MSYRVEITRRAMKGLAALPASIRSGLSHRIAALGTDPLPHGAESLRRALVGCHKLRVGDYRVVYEIDDTHRTVAILRVGHRHNVYK